MPIKISHQFDAGSIEVLSIDEPQSIRLNFRKDSHADVAQWFYFRLQGACGQFCTMHFMNASQTTFPGGWENYRAVASYDRETWFRVPTTYDGKALTIAHTPERDSIYYAYFEPYSWERHLQFLSRVDTSTLSSVTDIGSSIEGRDINMITLGSYSAPKKVWVIARQHPGETMSEWFVEGMVDALIDRANPVARRILERAVVHVVPNMNPDGAVRGNLRTNAAGANLNREWMNPSIEISPEVLAVRNKIHETGCDLFLDIHGDETLPCVFVAGCEMLEGFSREQASEQQAFIDAFTSASPDFQTERGYAPGKYREDMLKLASKYIGHTFKCVSLTLEMPFKDNDRLPDLEAGWNGARSARLGAAILQPILQSVCSVRAGEAGRNRT
jgi:murein tripeptide amidase MpaA